MIGELLDLHPVLNVSPAGFRVGTKANQSFQSRYSEPNDGGN